MGIPSEGAYSPSWPNRLIIIIIIIYSPSWPNRLIIMILCRGEERVALECEPPL
jgi:hypothetical protein